MAILMIIESGQTRTYASSVTQWAFNACNISKICCH